MGRFRNVRTGVVVSTATAPAGAGWEALDTPTRRKAPRKRTTAARTAEEPSTGSTDHDADTSASQRQGD